MSGVGRSQRVDTADGISWHVEAFSPSTTTETVPEYVVLIPSGEGDCRNLTKVAHLLASTGPYHVLTFDMPGFSRTSASAEAQSNVRPPLLAKQIIGLLDKLEIRRTSFFGCSSGGSAVLGLCALYPHRTKCGIVHEIPFGTFPVLVDMLSMADHEITAACENFFANAFVEQDINDGRKKWDGLGSDYHARLAKNYVTWVKGYINSVELGSNELASDPKNLQQRPIFWTVGGLNPGVEHEDGAWKQNFEMARAAGLEVNTKRLNCLHFPAVTVPEDTADWIRESVAKVKD
ncbi:hypothetical protein LTR64_003386 [Lithohypha guttulata]|uniref:uncharacterized protein n=1 Tax=Lithohypha guttulata TaxID=1690604 RepID=UPI002DE0643A|nr:hypothetical protein LTR51_000395 [Lithohypha guttulata]